MKHYSVSPEEKSALRKAGINLNSVLEYSVDEIVEKSGLDFLAVKKIRARAEFTSVRHVGPAFASDLIGLEIYSMEQAAAMTGEQIYRNLEETTGTKHDPCVLDQCNMIVYVAQTGDQSKSWWDFTPLRKKNRK